MKEFHADGLYRLEKKQAPGAFAPDASSLRPVDSISGG